MTTFEGHSANIDASTPCRSGQQNRHSKVELMLERYFVLVILVEPSFEYGPLLFFLFFFFFLFVFDELFRLMLIDLYTLNSNLESPAPELQAKD